MYPRLRILDRYIVREVLPPTGLGLLVFTFVLVLQRLAVLAAILISRSADLATTLALLGDALPSIFALTIPMAFLLGVLLAFGRLASESEIVAMRAGGLSPLQMLRPVVSMGLVAALLTLYVTGFAQPRSRASYRERLYSLVLGRARAGIKPKVFTDDIIKGMAFHVADIDADTGEWRDVFIADGVTTPRSRVILARRGRILVDEPARTATLVLREGTVYTQDVQNPALDTEEAFRSARLPIPFDKIFPEPMPVPDVQERSIVELWRGLAGGAPMDDGTRRFTSMVLHRRLAIPVACLVFGVLGLGLSLGHRKEARSAAFGLSIAVLCVYYVLLRAGEQAAANNLAPPWIGAWSANVVLGALAIGLLAMKQREAAFDPLSAGDYLSWLPVLSVTRRIRHPAAGPPRDPDRTRDRPRLGPGLLDRYVARHFLGFGALVLVAFWAVFLLFDFMDLFDDVQQHAVPGRVVVHYYAFLTPSIVHLVAPVAGLVATLATFGVLSRRNEIVAMLAGGISLFRVTAPALVLAGLGSGLLFTIGELVLPQSNRAALRDRDRIKGRTAQSSGRLQDRWLMNGDGRIYYYEYFAPGPTRFVRPPGAPETAFLHGLSVFDVDAAEWRLRERVQATVARWTGFNYELERGWRRTFGPEGRFKPFLDTRTRDIDPPSYFQREARDAELLPFLELRDHIAFMAERGADVAALEVQLHRKLAFPMTMVVMALLGIRFAFTVGRRGALYGIGVSVLIAIVYFVAMSLFEQMGNHALLPPLLAAWAPNLLFGAAGLYLLSTVET